MTRKRLRQLQYLMVPMVWQVLPFVFLDLLESMLRAGREREFFNRIRHNR